MIDGAEHRRRIVAIHEGARAVVDGFPRQQHVVGIHHPVNEADRLPVCDQSRDAARHLLEQCERRVRRVGNLRVMTCDDVVDQQFQAFLVLDRQEILQCADADMAFGDADQNPALQALLAVHRLAGGHRGQGTAGGHAEARHGFADQVLAQNRPERRAAVAVARERRDSGTLELHVVAFAVFTDNFAEQNCATVAEARIETAELVAGIHRGDRLGALRHVVAGDGVDAFGGFEP